MTHIKVERVDISEPSQVRGASRTADRGLVSLNRTVSEVGQVTVKAATLAALTERVAAHLALFDGEVGE